MFKRFCLASICALGIGAFLNLTVVVANGWHMPGRGAVYDGKTLGLLRSCPLTARTRLPFLSDVIPTYGIRGTDYCSIGDILAVAGFFSYVVFAAAFFWTEIVAKEAAKRIRAAPSPRGGLWPRNSE